MNKQTKRPFSVGNKDKNICEVRQVMQSENCDPAKRLKLCWWIALLSHVGTHWDGKTVNESKRRNKHVKTYTS